MTKKSFALLILALGFAAAGFAQVASQPAVQAPAKTADIAGVWELTMQTPQGEMTRDATFTQEKDAIKVTMEGPMGEMKGEGTIKENDIQWTMSISTPQRRFRPHFQGQDRWRQNDGRYPDGRHGHVHLLGQEKEVTRLIDTGRPRGRFFQAIAKGAA